jgi:CRP-like cAMP-binding protein
MQWELLRGLPDDEREAVLGAMRTRRFRRGDVVFHEGDAGDSVHFVAEGHAAVRVTTPGGETATLSVLGPGQAFHADEMVQRDKNPDTDDGQGHSGARKKTPVHR